MSNNDQIEKLRNMVLAFRMNELQTLMVFAGRYWIISETWKLI